ncbi:bifunctional 4-hydroxy-2-oxoglutarate aldolase/2-dehydro-3-deoxy-phosphogluconate aldolase [Tessaracoccus sp. MC1627]|uniref:bifunctional 4-hydroxy-2-oxoglutarate aldolase/2-dehydro-3-deoxy-phosphogluconate aldolase n=1 Tax=Tessaracoccus sp. MC1627 TaxID=2760312 RepID=UPI001603F249|nr:bifunctional 4-hydroxy-2-oxoglutarate aldolase/2-dehydro-3-deoxy-phosphogluconate aldolase [Tessaracoccus sp. MC1627]MBB1513221.1 bifunctional 4-hydroxy-2-oxoglutarate aldolase/2-dehydro-3-deoxy-phosphogluconate aldolase [Tessaracoccus sp. MC1627]MBB1513446.1 bifunctional 4-hydroxy-2-oxoglutarate aldolase/2-dehydro-3-deoxy-phosphogluconate aldolase [Tessaracoccus sp. MC1627]
MHVADNPIIPVVVINRADRTEALGEALVAGGIPIAEVTFRTEAAPEAIRRMSANAELLVGAGTVLSAGQVDQALDAGARFIVSPGFSAEVVRRAQHHGLPVFPGAVTPSEIMAALDLGLTTLKFFPANIYGGPAALKALGAPFPQVRFIPTGGVAMGNLADFLTLPNVAAVGGSWMVPANLVDASDMDTIRRLCTEASAAVASFGKAA